MQAAAKTAIDKGTDKPLRLTKRIGSTTYKVSVHFSQTSKETVDDKIMRLIEKDVSKP